ncbi:MAG: ABC transporter substrate-binding protein [Desulfobacteraceae bacterium]|nr:ABC transporter substrate-binding protein [Desulfobacteraceae bacterium]MBC2752144.1 ABC transporter substrate-binding protein [Desulfobacteraceae bacterium]
MRNHRVMGIGWAVALCLTLFAAFPPAAATGAEKLTYRLKWLFNTSVVGDLYADVRKEFAAAGLDVTVKPGGPERDAIKELELGQAQFGVASADQVIRAMAKGSPVVVIAQLFQVNPLQWIYRQADPPITRLEDLRGRTIGITYGGNDETIMRTILAKAGLTEQDVRLFSVRYDYTPFYQKKVDIWPVYRNTQGIFIGQKMMDGGEPVQFFIPSDYGIQFVANSVVTSRQMAEERPETVRQFLTALLKGWEEALDPAKSSLVVEMLQEFDKDTPRKQLAEQLEITRRLVKPQSGVAIGVIDRDAWIQTEKIMYDQKQIVKPVHVETALMPRFAF